MEAEETLPTLRELGISFMAYSPLGRSLLTGRTRSAAEIPSDDRRRDHPRFQEENLKKNLDLLKPLDDMARKKGCTPGQLALAWLLARGRDIVPIPGTKRKDRLEENVGAADVRLTPDEVAALQDADPRRRRRGRALPGARDEVGLHLGPGARGGLARDVPRHRLPLGGGPERPPHGGVLLRPHRRRGRGAAGRRSA